MKTHYENTINALCEGLSENKIEVAKHMFSELRKNSNLDSNFIKVSFPIARRVLGTLNIINEKQSSNIATQLTNYVNQNVHRIVECNLIHGDTSTAESPLDYEAELMSTMSEEFIRFANLVGIGS